MSLSRHVKESEEVIVEPHPESNQRRRHNLITSGGSPLAHAYQFWSTSIYAFVTDTHTEWERESDRDRQTDRDTRRSQYMLGLYTEAHR